MVGSYYGMFLKSLDIALVGELHTGSTLMFETLILSYLSGTMVLHSAWLNLFSLHNAY